MSEEERTFVIETGLFTSKGDLTVDLAAGVSETRLPDDADAFMIWHWDRKTANRFKNARGKEVEVLVLEFTNNLQLLSSTPGQILGRQMQGLGMMAVSTIGATAFKAAIASGQGVSVAINADIAAIGGAAVFTVVAGALAVLLIVGVLLARNAAGITIIVNDTDEDLRWDDYEQWSGRIKAVFVEKPLEEKPKMAILGRRQDDDDTVDQGSDGDIVCAGLLSVQKKLISIVGPHGAMGFKPTTHFSSGIKIGWDSPNTWPAKNKILVSATDTGSYADFRKMTFFDDVRISVSKTQEGQVRGEIHATRNSIFCGIVYVSQS